MNGFFQLLRRFSHLLFFLGLEGLCFYMMSRTPSMQGVDVLTSANAISGSLYKRQNAVAQYLDLPRENDSLLAENARLHATLARIQYERDTLRDSAASASYEELQLATSTDSSRVIRYAQYNFRTARVVNNSVSERNNFVTLARGTQDGVREGQAVISAAGGLVGLVMYATDHFSVAISVLSDFKPVSAMLKNGTLGTVRWRYGSPEVLRMEDIPLEEKVFKGDSVLTTSFSYAPPNVLVGRVEKLQRNKTNNTQTLFLRPTANFRNLRHVYVVENTFLKERQAVEDSAKAVVDKLLNTRRR
jgi:rod shape-determining protein MreC